MVERTNNKIVREIDKLNETEFSAVADYISRLLSERLLIQTENHFNDDLIASLSDKRENQRARQVLEWENVRKRNILRAA